MIIRELKLKLNKKQIIQLNEWFNILTSIYNWGLRKIELNAKDKIYFSSFDFRNLLANHCKKLNIPSHTIQTILLQSYKAWRRCFKKLSKKPKFKSNRNKLNSIPFSDTFKEPKDNRITIPLLGKVKYYKQDLPNGKIKCGRIIHRPSGWYLLLWIDTIHKFQVKETNKSIGIDLGFNHLLTLSNGIKIENPRELRKGQERLSQAQRGRKNKLSTRLLERQANRRNDRNHKISRWLVENYNTIYYPKDNLNNISKKFGKSIQEASLGKLIAMVNYKVAVQADRKAISVESNYTTMTCSVCGSKTGPTGLDGLKVRDWVCSVCGTHHDRDVNSACNILNLGLGCNLKSLVTEKLTEMSDDNINFF